MTKSLFISPEESFQQGKIHFEDIPVNSYGSHDIGEEIAKFGKDAVLNMLWDMCYIRVFEEGVAEIRKGKDFHGISEGMPSGPAHVAVGQEAAAVGQAFCLKSCDMIYGTHRAHAELLARGLKAIRDLSRPKLFEVMLNTSGGEIYKIINNFEPAESMQNKARDFLLYGTLAEIFCKKTGFQKGAAGSMHVCFTPFGCYPNNAIVGASAPIATGSALYKRVNKQDGIIVANIGDGAIGCGIVYESMNFAAMDQLNGLWQEKGGLPIVFVISDNGYGMGGQTRGETMAYDMPARLGAGITPGEMHAERVNGNDPFAVIDAMRRKREEASCGEGPVLLDVVTYRLEGHSVSDKMSYREECEVEQWRKYDPIKILKERLVAAEIISLAEFEDKYEEIESNIIKIFKLVADDTISPVFSASSAIDFYKEKLFNNVKYKFPKSVDLGALNAGRQGKINNLPSRKELSIRDALFESILYNMFADDKLITYGEEVRDWGGISGVYEGLTEIMPYERLFNSPISEATIISSAIGYAFAGGRAVVEIMFADFLARTGDEIINQLAKWHTMSAGGLKLSVVVRCAVGSKYGSQHSQDFSSLFAAVPGLKIVFPVTPYDAKGMLNAAIRDGNPVLFFECQKLYGKHEEFKAEVPIGYYEVPIGVPDIKKVGSDVTIITFGETLYNAVNVAKLIENDKINAEIIDLMTISPLNTEKIIASVKKTGRVVLAGNIAPTCSILDSIAREITEKCFKELKAPPMVLSTPNCVVPPAIYCGDFYIVDDELLNAVKYVMKD